MFQNSLYDTLSVVSPFKGMHENVPHIASEELQGLASYIENFILTDSNIKLRHGTKEILSFLRKDEEENVLGYSPKNIKILNIEFYKDGIWFLFYEKSSGWIAPRRKADIDNKIRITLNNLSDTKKAALKRGALTISFKYTDDGGNVVHLERIDDFYSLEINDKTNTATVILQPIYKDKHNNIFYTADELSEVKYISAELVAFLGNKIIVEDDVVAKKLNLGTRGRASCASNEDYFVFGTGVDPIIVFDATESKFVKPRCYVERQIDENRSDKKEETIDWALYPVLTSLVYYNNKFFGLFVNENFKTSLIVAYSKSINDPTNWFADKLIVHEGGAVSEEVVKEVTLLKLDLSAMHGCNDKLLSIVPFDNDLVFIGEKRTQLWNRGSFDLKGGDPDKVRIESMQGSEGIPINFDTYKIHIDTLTARWKKTYDVGAIAAGCIAHTDIGVFFISRGGVRLLAYDETLLKPVIKVNSIGGVDQMILNYFGNEKERAPESFVYTVGGLFGFRFGSTCIVGHIRNNSFLGWTSFTGSFAADKFSIDFNGNLVMFRDEFNIYPSITAYDDGKSSMPDFYDILYNNPEHRNAGSYSDQVWVKKEHIDDFSIEDSYIDIEFIIPLDTGGKFACKYLMIIADYFTTMNIDPDNRVELVVGSDLPNVSFNNTDMSAAPITVESRALFRWMGDKFYTLKIDQSRMSDTGASPLIERCKFVGKRFKVGLIGSLRYTEFSFKKIELYGIIERN